MTKMTRFFTLLLFCTLLTSCFDPGKVKNSKKVVESMTNALIKKNRSVPYRSYDDVKELQDLVLIDVREDYERLVSVLPASITKAEFEANKKKYIQSNVIVYCTVGIRSTEYAKKILPEGFIVAVLKGGVLGWAHEGKIFATPDGKDTKKVHVYSEAWNLLPEGYEGVY